MSITDELAQALRTIMRTLPSDETCCNYPDCDAEGMPSCCGNPIIPLTIAREALARYDATKDSQDGLVKPDYSEIGAGIAATIAKCSKPLTESQRIVMIGAVAIYAEKAIADALSQRQQVPDGMVLVPKEPTEAMLEEGRAALRYKPMLSGSLLYSNDVVKQIYAAALAAAPKG